jgi:cytochrome o ubiquinol oxidase operon protein cyoD
MSERVASNQQEPGSEKTYVIGYVSALALTLAAYVLVVRDVLSGWALTVALIALALVQVLVQLFFFLHLGREARPRWKLVVFLFMLLVLGILVFGSLWIMNNLDYNMMHRPAGEIDAHIMDEERIYR